MIVLPTFFLILTGLNSPGPKEVRIPFYSLEECEEMHQLLKPKFLNPNNVYCLPAEEVKDGR